MGKPGVSTAKPTPNAFNTTSLTGSYLLDRTFTFGRGMNRQRKEHSLASAKSCALLQSSLMGTYSTLRGSRGTTVSAGPRFLRLWKSLTRRFLGLRKSRNRHQEPRSSELQVITVYVSRGGCPTECPNWSLCRARSSSTTCLIGTRLGQSTSTIRCG